MIYIIIIERISRNIIIRKMENKLHVKKFNDARNLCDWVNTQKTPEVEVVNIAGYYGEVKLFFRFKQPEIKYTPTAKVFSRDLFMSKHTEIKNI